MVSVKPAEKEYFQLMSVKRPIESDFNTKWVFVIHNIFDFKITETLKILDLIKRFDVNVFIFAA